MKLSILTAIMLGLSQTPETTGKYANPHNYPIPSCPEIVELVNNGIVVDMLMSPMGSSLSEKEKESNQFIMGGILLHKLECPTFDNNNKTIEDHCPVVMKLPFESFVQQTTKTKKYIMHDKLEVGTLSQGFVEKFMGIDKQ